MSRVFMVADLHFGHDNAIRFRNQFSTIQEHDEYIINAWNQTVLKRDTVFVLGDFSFKADKTYVDAVRDRLNGYIKFVQGNHDLIIPYNVRLYPPLVSYKGYWLSHAPIHPFELRGKRNIHGHTHSFKIPDENYVCVSLEQTNFRPKLFTEIIKERGAWENERRRKERNQ